AWVLTSEVRHNLFLAVKEALHNVVKHARATEVRITLTLVNHSFAWEVQDNGCGFVRGKTSQSSPDRLASGNGMANMHRRLDEIGGHCELRSDPGAGVCVKFVVPVKATES
ncbi:MAG: histidine kinase, partial [Verrucomicrobia bacterium]